MTNEIAQLLREAARGLRSMGTALDYHESERPHVLAAELDQAASLEAQEPVATVLGCDPFDERPGLRLSIDDWATVNALPKGTKLYADYPPTSAVPEWLEKAARWVEQRRDNYIDEHGSFDPGTGVTEFPGDGADYVGELDEIAEGIRSLSAAPQQETSDA